MFTNRRWRQVRPLAPSSGITLEQGCQSPALRVPLAVTWLTVYRQLSSTDGGAASDREVVGIALLCYYYQR